MSLVGSLEDLGLGDILQIIHLSRKSGILVLRSEHGEGQILFDQGLIRGAFRKGGPTDLRELLGARKELDGTELEAAVEEARSRGLALDRVLRERDLVDEAALDALRRENVEATVVRMFGWPSGEFSFEVRDLDPEAVEELFVSPGMNPQFLALEGTRRLDEEDRPDEEAGAPLFAGEEDAAALPAADLVEEEDAVAEATAVEDAACDPGTDGAALPMAQPAPAAEPGWGEEVEEAVPAVEATAADRDVEVAETDVAEAEAAGAMAPPAEVAAPQGPPPPVVAIHRELPVLEWMKTILAADHPRVHIFQTSELGIARIRQYLARRELPLVVIAADAPADPVSGARDTAELLRRLKAQAPRLAVVVTVPRDAEPPRVRGDAWGPTPTLTDVLDSRAVAARDGCAEALRRALREAAPRPQPGPRPRRAEVARLREVSARIRDPRTKGEVLPQVLAFAAEHFARVAIFMIRDGRAIGLAQVGLPRAGGPDDAALRDVDLPSGEPAWFRRVLESRAPVRGAPGDEADHRLAVLLGNAIPGEAYVAPLESSGEVVALLYADNLPGGAPLGDTSALEVVLHQAGLALDRAVLERALAEAES